MKKILSLRNFLYIDILILLVLIFYKSYLFIYESDFQSNNIENIKEIKKMDTTNDFTFVVLGNIENSIDVFNKKMITKINSDKDVDFLISTGDAVLDGAEDKYRILNKSLNKLNIPSVLAIGDNEVSDEGDERFYRHFGPFYFSFALEDSYFVFLDTTGKTSIPWQKEWLTKELKNAKNYKYKYIFMNNAPFKIKEDTFLKSKEHFITDQSYRDFLIDIYSRYNVTAVFTTGPEIYESRQIKGVNYFVSGGGGGGLLTDRPNSFYHYMKVDVKPSGVSYSVVKQETPAKYALTRRLESLWIYIHSFFYINFINFILVISVLLFFAIAIHIRATKEVDYYKNFNESAEHIPTKDKLNIAMFTNNYLPFIGGVPISIWRLVKGLKNRGHNVYIFAPEYPGKVTNDESNIIRCKLLKYLKTKQFKFAIVNIFSSNIEKNFSKYDFDVVHVHHPFWLGATGLKLGKKYKIPVVLTYHTRLEKYSHFLPCFKLIFKNILSHKIIRRFSQSCNAIIAPTNTAKQYLENIGVSRDKFVLPTGIDFDYYNNIDKEQLINIGKKYKTNGEILLCSVSRLSKEKNIYFLLKAIKYIKENTDISFRCIIIGNGPEKDNILQFIKDESLEDTVSLLGSIPPEDIPKYYMVSDIFVFSSLSETQGMVLLEAMAGGDPVVAVRSSGIDDIIQDNYNGFKTKEEIDDLAQKVILLMENQYLLKEMSANAYGFSERFSLDKMAERVEKAYYKSIKEKKIYNSPNENN
ncbi:MAG: glycosyltransferase [Firmicutes bacterium]|nr:glycosyltransferase [Bacillota bacterium]